jgi:hypothetical protein
MKLTPSDIVNNKMFYSIPIYQRLFEWDTDNIITLLEDLKKTYFLSNGCDDYYIGMLTTTQENELVDGQQRFTVMMLLGCVLQHYYPEWKAFLVSDNSRLYFTSRPKDNAFMRILIDGIENNNQRFENKKMLNGYRQIKAFIENENHIEKKDLEHFASYIYHHLSFFISILPSGYNPRDLNKYFERMNTSGKNLEQHEILKVKLLSNLPSNISTYMLLWNKLSDVDTLIIRKHKEEKEEDFCYRKQIALSSNIETILSHDVINGLGSLNDEENTSIISIQPSSEVPRNERETIKNSRCALTFPYLLLQTLYRMIDGNIKSSIEDFFRPSNLLDIFAQYLPYEGKAVNVDNIKAFMERLVKSRLALDICFVRPTEYGYSLDMNLNEDDEKLQKLLMLQSMIFVSSSNYTHYRWFTWLMDAIDQSHGMPDVSALYSYLKSKDDNRNPLPPYEALSFGEIRYWFWRLDFYIWLNRKTIFMNDPDALNVADNFVFKRNRSIEHIAPQTPMGDSTMKWDDTADDIKMMNSFGNLVMISQGLNSALSNESYEVKKAHVQSYCNGSKGGSIESLKLLIVHQQYKYWDKNCIEEHGHLMYEWLEKSFLM